MNEETIACQNAIGLQNTFITQEATNTWLQKVHLLLEAELFMMDTLHKGIFIENGLIF